ncbi:uncharacterized protein LOC142598410 [Balearica regulorum gibbericeps]|uniref:uncharacterized protein LOC142598410 n=1 Tax=Balearica regulorum gibbericeps TaxID=100784 RepID=UPI003F636109
MAARGLLGSTGLLWLCLGGWPGPALGRFLGFLEQVAAGGAAAGVAAGPGWRPQGEMSPRLVPTAPAALLRLHQPQPVLTVETGKEAKIVCEASEAMEHEANVFWYRRDGGNGPSLVLNCESRNKSRFSCEFTQQSVTLRIDHAHPNDTGLYLCAYEKVSYLHFGSGTTLLVGDSWMGTSWVMVLAPRGAPQGPPGLVCAMGNTTGPVLVSWPGGPRRVLGLGGGTGPLVSPMGTATGTGGLCQVRFNASGPPIQRSAELLRVGSEYGEHPPQLGHPWGN